MPLDGDQRLVAHPCFYVSIPVLVDQPNPPLYLANQGTVGVPSVCHARGPMPSYAVPLPIFYRTTHYQAISAVIRRHDDDLDPLRDMTIRY